MLCLSDSIRDDDPCVQRLCCMVEEAHTLSALILTAWSSVARSRVEPQGEIWHHRGVLRCHALVAPPLVPHAGC